MSGSPTPGGPSSEPPPTPPAAYPPPPAPPPPPPPPPAPGPFPGGVPYGYQAVPLDRLGRPLADWWQRFVAIVIDGLIIGVVYWILAAAVVSSSLRTGLTHFAFRLWLVQVIVGLGAIAYFALLEGSERGQSVGMMALGIAVRDATTGGTISRSRAGARMVILYPWLVLIMIPLIGGVLGFLGDIWTLICGLSPLWNPARQGYHDIAQNTSVIKTR